MSAVDFGPSEFLKPDYRAVQLIMLVGIPDFVQFFDAPHTCILWYRLMRFSRFKCVSNVVGTCTTKYNNVQQ